MSRSAVAFLTAVALALPAVADAQALYRYTDPSGRVVYSDQPPPAAAKDVQAKRLQENVIETDTSAQAARDAAEKNPLTLYTWDCDVCKQAEAFLVKRGVPYQTVIVSEEEGAAKLKALTGKQSAPVLKVGEKQVITGFSANRWGTALDEAGYPKTPPLTRPAARAAAAAPAAAKPAEPAPAPQPPPRGTDYPK